MSIKRYILVFVLALGSNLVWENLHARLYIGYQGGQITEWILARATFWDAIIITSLCFLASFLPSKTRLSFVAASGFLIAVLMERWALATSRWEYAPSMPVLPILHTGLTPTIQLAILGLAAMMIVRLKFKD